MAYGDNAYAARAIQNSVAKRDGSDFGSIEARKSAALSLWDAAEAAYERGDKAEYRRLKREAQATERGCSVDS